MDIFKQHSILASFLTLLVALILLIVGFLAYLEKQGASHGASADTQTDQDTILEGTYVCLPHTDGSKVKECTPGLRVEKEYYALDLAAVIEAGGNPSLIQGAKVAAAGLIVPIEEISSDQWRQYPVKGIMHVLEIAKQ